MQVGEEELIEFTESQMAEGKSVRLWSCRLEFDAESGQTNDLKLVFTASLLFSIRRTVLVCLFVATNNTNQQMNNIIYMQ